MGSGYWELKRSTKTRVSDKYLPLLGSKPVDQTGIKTLDTRVNQSGVYWDPVFVQLQYIYLFIQIVFPLCTFLHLGYDISNVWYEIPFPLNVMSILMDSYVEKYVLTSKGRYVYPRIVGHSSGASKGQHRKWMS